ncbi:MAG: transposase [Synergistaceae bacterium]|nr:transposase [Synergistaceae bacterium]
MDRQLSLAQAESFEKYRKATRRSAFLYGMESLVPWKKLCDRVAPFYPAGERGRPPRNLEQMIRIYLLQDWFSLNSREAEEILYENRAMREFARIDLWKEPVPEESTLRNFSRLLKKKKVDGEIIAAVTISLNDRGVKLTRGTIREPSLAKLPSGPKKIKEPSVWDGV